MQYTHIQIEPTLKTETKRTSLYTYIRSAHKMIKTRTEIRKHRTLPNDAYLTEKCQYIEKIDTNKVVPHVHTNALSPPPSWSWRHQRQLALPPLESTSPVSFSEGEEEEDMEDQDDELESSDDEDFEQEQELDNYSITLQKLSGITLVDRVKKNTAVLITLSPCALAAANAARQRRQRARVNA
jgi:hypothetical protein